MRPGSSIKSEVDNVIYGNPIKIEITKNENSVMTIHADTLIRANGGNTTLFGRIYADLFDKKGVKSSMMYSDSAIVYTNSDSIKAFGNVLIESLKGYKLITEERSEPFGDTQKLNQINRKLDSLNSLTILAKLEKSVEALRVVNYE